MKKLIVLTASVSLLALAACGDKAEKKQAPAQPPATSEAPATSSAMDTAKDMATKAVEALKLDTSSLDAFKASLAKMQASLSPDDQSKLTAALGKLASSATSSSGGGDTSSMMDAAKGMMSGGDVTSTLYEKMGAKLNGLTFNDILKMAG
ncbi:DUF6694 family lipoprotein [Kordiimonas marina]|uniref:DUF6694 family lipoprotein n=1 Tax=Kordiimonas marina TaxID=2872312 RepID=UPI001FF158AC|nr:DUF6694 family lipoprotein [Kordiimonas marina]MCJ9429142.1 hypothetical protein [Kordiimonas marina]